LKSKASAPWGDMGQRPLATINPVGMGDRGTGLAMLTPPKDERSAQTLRNGTGCA
jgi:hypothetical protein